MEVVNELYTPAVLPSGHPPAVPLELVTSWALTPVWRFGEVFLPVAGIEPLVVNHSTHSLVPTDYLRRSQPVAREQHVAREDGDIWNKGTCFKPVLGQAQIELQSNFENLWTVYL